MGNARLNKLNVFPQDRFSAFSAHCKLYMGHIICHLSQVYSPHNSSPRECWLSFFRMLVFHGIKFGNAGLISKKPAPRGSRLCVF